MKLTNRNLLLLFALLTATPSSFAQIRWLDNLFAKDFVDNQDNKPSYYTQWPIEKNENGWQVKFYYSDSEDIYFSGTLKTLSSNNSDFYLLSSQNIIGDFSFFNRNGTLDKTGSYEIGSKITSYCYNQKIKKIEEYVGAYSLFTLEEYDCNEGKLIYQYSGSNKTKFAQKTSNEYTNTSSYYAFDQDILKHHYIKYDKNGAIASTSITFYAENGTSFESIYDKNNQPIQIESKIDTGDGFWKVTEKYENNVITDKIQKLYNTNIDGVLDGEQFSIEYAKEEKTSHYKMGKLQGEYKVLKDNQIKEYGQYENGLKIGDWYQKNNHDYTITQYDKAETISKTFTVGADYITFDEHNRPYFEKPDIPTHRTLPAIGHIWAYSNSDYTYTFTLQSVKDELAYFEIKDSDGKTFKQSENIATGTPVEVNATPQQMDRYYVFPLDINSHWKDKISKKVTFNRGNNIKYEYQYDASVITKVLRFEKMTVAAGTFDTIMIDKKIYWQKSNPKLLSDENSDKECASKSCSLSGITHIIYWYAPSVGQNVLSAREQVASEYYINTNINRAPFLVTELTYSGDELHLPKDIQTGLLASLPTTSSYGFPLMYNNTWEFLMARDWVD